MNAGSDIVPAHFLYRIAWGAAAVGGGLTVVIAYLSEIPWVLRLLPLLGVLLTLIGLGCAGLLVRNSGSVANSPWLHHAALGVNAVFLLGFILSMVGR
jgi:hypothetical protein